MSFRAHALSFIDTALRVPPLFIMDEVLKSCFGLSSAFHVSSLMHQTVASLARALSTTTSNQTGRTMTKWWHGLQQRTENGAATFGNSCAILVGILNARAWILRLEIFYLYCASEEKLSYMFSPTIQQDDSCKASSQHHTLCSRYSKLLGDENPFLNDEGFGHLNTEDMKNWAAENDTSNGMEEYLMFTSILPTVAKIFMFLLVYITATVAFLLSSQHLIQVYLIVASMAVVVSGYQGNMAAVRYISSPQSDHPPVLHSMLSLNTTALWDNRGTLSTLGVNCIFQGSLGYLFTLLYSGPQYPVLHKLIIFSFLLPTVSMLCTVPSGILSTVPLIAALLPLAIVKYTLASNLLKCTQVVLEGYQYARRVMRDFGLHSLLESEWVRLNVPNVLRTFWIIRVVHHVVTLLGEFTYAKGEYQSLWALDLQAAYGIFKAVMTQGCETAVALLGMTSIVSYISHFVGVVFQMILLTVEDDERSMGTVCAILFFILAEQSGLTVMEAEKRFIRLCRNFCLLFTAMLHFIHNMVNPVLMSLSASRNPALYRHVRALIVCSLLVFLPVFLLFVLWSFYPLSTWLLAVSAFSVQVIVKTKVSLLIYGLFLVDAYRSTFWEKLDDYVYYIKAFGNSVEFIFGILLFFNGAWIYFFESGGSIRAFMMCIHAYFNIWCEARNGWTVFMKRCTAVNKINSLPEATQEQLNKHDDVCAICFHNLQNAKITKCNHYFHSVCLRKWLYVQDSCPLCHETLYKTETPNDQQTPAENVGDMIWDMEPDQEFDMQVHQPNEDVHNAEIQLWADQDIDVILGENMNGRNREMVIDNEVGEAVFLPPQVQNLEDREMHQHQQFQPQPQGLPSQRLQQHINERDLSLNENNQIFTLRSRRGPIIDQDIGQQ